jgi:hypothetical protein
MKLAQTLLLIVGVLGVLAWAGTATAGEGGFKARITQNRATVYPWHGYYYDPAWGMPIALVVPPTAESQTHWGWGVGNTRVTTINHQFHRDYPGPGVYDRRGFLPTPPWPSDTDQFGVYYVRGPW